MEVAFKAFLAAWFFTNFEPIKDQITAWYGKFYGTWLQPAFDILSCFKCFSFWAVLLVTFDPFYAVAASFVASIYTDVVEK